ncbi:MAG TPA: 7-cyano-7-deazaguanine synthase [Candidatus Binataceae bacterium]|nr:7-cyano-7-deazaguanine synthase [Candidatus Binataceae bacterium]
MKSFRVTPVHGRVAVLASGGLDSSVLLAQFAASGRQVFPVYVRAGLRWERAELTVLRRFIAALRARNHVRIEPIAISVLPPDAALRRHWTVTGRGVPGLRARVESNYIVGRNLTLLARAAIFCANNRIGEVAMAPLESNPFPDARPEFFRAMERAIALGVGLRLRVITPFVGLTKAQVVKRGRALPLRLTLSCANPRGTLHCGSCTKCAERMAGFADAGIEDPTRYARKPAGH